MKDRAAEKRDQAPAVRRLGALSEAERSLAGGKGAALARLLQAGYPVPDGCVLLPAAFEGDELKPEAWTQVQACLARMREPAGLLSFAVRSSALVEDSARASFAGEFETVLDVAADEEVQAAIRAVRRSRHSERVRAYLAAQGLAAVLEPGPLEMAVVVQRLVRAEIAGVLFTADPVSGSRDRMVGSYVHGLGEGLVAGEVTGQAFALERPKGSYEGPPKLKRLARRLFKLARRLERDFDDGPGARALARPQDIEWAIAGDKLYLLQARPITSLQGFDPLTGAFNDSLTGDFVWSSVNIGEALSVVMTPYTWSAVRTAFDELNMVPGYASVGNIGGRAYQNVTVMASMFTASGQDQEALVKEMGGVRDEYLDTMGQYLVRLPEATFWAVLPGALRLIKKRHDGLKDLPAFLEGNRAWCQEVCQRIEAVETRDGLVPILLDELLPRVRQSFWRTVATAWRYAERAAKLRTELKEMVGAAEADALLSNVSGEGELLASMGPLVGLARVARGEMSREDYMAQWGHRGPLETETSEPRPFEDPAWLDEQLAAFARSPVDVEARLAAQRAAFDAAWERFRARYPRHARPVGRRLAQAAKAARMREAVRSEFARLVWVARVWALRAGELAGLGEGAFFLTWPELLGVLAGDEALAATLPARRQTYEEYKRLPPYPLLIRGRFDPFQWAADPERRTDVYDAQGLLQSLTLEAPEENVILGMPGSAGRVEGVVRRLDHPDEGETLQPGEVLVTAQTNIGWTLFFPRAAAIITDVGAPLSHAAIVARELGIPAVVNCGDATGRLRTGDRVHVDGSQGVVEILERAAGDQPPGGC